MSADHTTASKNPTKRIERRSGKVWFLGKGSQGQACALYSPHWAASEVKTWTGTELPNHIVLLAALQKTFMYIYKFNVASFIIYIARKYICNKTLMHIINLITYSTVQYMYVRNMQSIKDIRVLLI